MSTTHVKIEELQDGPGGTAHLEKTLEAIPQVQSVEIDLGSGCAIVEHDGVAPAVLIAALQKRGYRATAT